MWDNDILDAFNLKPGQRFVLGDAPDAWAFPRQLLPAGHLPIVDYTEDKARWCPSGAWLEPGTRTQIQFGSIRVIAWTEVPEAGVIDFHDRRGLNRFLAFFAASAAGMTALLVAACYSVPPLAETPRTPLAETILGFPSDVTLNAIADPFDPEPPPPATPASEVYPVKHGLTGNSRCGGEKDMGTPLIAQGSRYGIRGPKDNPDPHLSRSLVEHQWNYEGRERVYDEIGPFQEVHFTDTRGPTAPWGREGSLGTDEVSARGNMWGEGIADADGEEGIAGLAHLDGGEVKAIDVNREEPKARPARVIHTQGHVKGPLPLAAMERAFASQLASFRDCYSTDPASAGNREGRLELDVAVDTEGRLAAASVTQLEQVSATTAECMLERVKAITFAKADSESEVTYPLLLVPGELPAMAPVERVTLAPAITRTNDPVIPCGGTVRHPTPRGECKR